MTSIELTNMTIKLWTNFISIICSRIFILGVQATNLGGKKKKKSIHMRFPIKFSRLRKARFFQKLSIDQKFFFFYQILMLIMNLKCQDSVPAKQKIINLAFACGCSNVAGYKSELIFMLFWICISSSHFQALRAKLGILTVLTVMIWNRLH